MREHLPKFIIIGLLVLIVGVPIVLRPANSAESDPNAPRLVVFTPHNEQIRYEIETAFNDWRASQSLPEVVFDWRTPGGTSDIRKSIISQFTAAIQSGKDLDEQGIGADVFFGGGEYDHNLVAKGIELDIDGVATRTRVVTDPQIDPKLFAEVFPEPRIGGEKLFGTYVFEENDEQGRPTQVELVGWTGVTLSSFGIVFNRDSLEQLGLDEPTTWSDLGDPRLLGWVALADPGHSGSISATFDTILKREGWTQGWRTLRQAFGNARYFATKADRVPVDVSRGDAAVGMCIDFYGRFQASSVGSDRVGYNDPVVDGLSMTATTADPITLLRGAPNEPLARAFIAWLLTKDAQALWQRSVSDGSDDLVRPSMFELRRQPLRADLYNEDAQASWVDRDLNPYPTAVPFPEGTPSYFSMVAPVTKAMASEIHDDMVAAWKALNDAIATNHPEREKMETLFYAMPPELTLTWPDEELEANWLAIQQDDSHPRQSEVIEHLAAFKARLGTLKDSNDASVLEANRIKWRSFFQDNYRAVVELGGS
jgi:ABC-type glycerol-3-phosphate transport system substrate-binding protein